MLDRPPPHSVESEAALLGSILMKPEKLVEVMDELFPEQFYRTAHGQIYQAMINLYAESGLIDVITVANELQKKKCLEDVGGHFYLTKLVNEVVTPEYIMKYASIIREKWAYREAISKSHSIIKSSYEEEDIKNILETAGDLSLIESVMKRPDESFAEILHSVNEEIDLRRAGKFRTGIKTGISRVDKIIKEYFPGELITVAGHTSSGKTSFALQTVNYNAMLGKPCGIIGMEMTKKEYAVRFLAMNSEQNISNIMLGHLNENGWRRFADAQAKIASAPISISDKPRLDFHEIKSIARQWRRKKKIELLIVDNLKNMKLSSSDSRANAIEDAVQEFKSLAKELDIVVMILSHISRDHDRKYRRPTLLDLKGSSAFEQDSDCVMFVWQPYKYEDTPDRDLAEIYIDKRRNGPLGTTNAGSEYRLRFVGSLAYFSEEL